MALVDLLHPGNSEHKHGNPQNMELYLVRVRTNTATCNEGERAEYPGKRYSVAISVWVLRTLTHKPDI